MAHFRILKRQTIYQGRIIRLVREVIEVNHRRIIRETVKHPGAVVIIPLLEDSRVVLIRQYRRAIEREILELPAGTLCKGERPEECARRELEEETGWRAGRLHRIAQFYAAPGFISEQMTLFVAQDLTRVSARPEPDELLRPVVTSLATAIAKVRSGKICDAKTIIGILYAERYLSRVYRARISS